MHTVAVGEDHSALRSARTSGQEDLALAGLEDHLRDHRHELHELWSATAELPTLAELF